MKGKRYNSQPRIGRGEKRPPSDEGCQTKNGDLAGKRIVAEYLYLDLNTCDRCMGTDGVLEEVLLALSPALRLAGYTVELRKIEINSEALAQKYRFLSSPTIRINGRDILGPVQENRCGCCSQISGADVDCRVFEFEGASYEIPPKQMLADAILKAVFAAPCGEEPAVYAMPANLKAFFQGMKSKSRCSCGGDCCK